MKFTFICIVIVISCSVCASNDLDILSGLDLDFNKPRGLPRYPDYDRLKYYPKFRFPFENFAPDEYDEPKIGETPEFNSVPDKIRQFEKVIDWELTQLHKHRPRHVPPALQYYLDKHNRPERFELDIPSENRIEEPRMYPSDEEIDYKNKIDDKTEDVDNIFDDSSSEKIYEESERVPQNELAEEKIPEPRDMHHDHVVHPNDKDTIEFTSNRFKNVQVVQDPSEFGYRPSDPRFYRKAETRANNFIQTIPTTTTTTTTTTTQATPKLNFFGSDKFLVTPRKDQKFLRDDDLTQEENVSKGEGIEVVPIQPNMSGETAGVYIIAIVAGISAAATVGLIAVGIGWYNLQKHVKGASDVEYPAYGVTGPNKDLSPSGDRRLAQSAQMYHYQHQKQQVIAMERAPPGERPGSLSDAESDEENEEGDYTVYECPGLAPTGEMEVKNPLFQDDPTPAQTPATKTNEVEKK